MLALDVAAQAVAVLGAVAVVRIVAAAHIVVVLAVLVGALLRCT